MNKVYRKLPPLVLCMLLLWQSAAAAAQDITASMPSYASADQEKLALEEVIHELGRSYQTRFNYNSKIIKDKYVFLQLLKKVEHQPLDVVLETILSPLDLSFEKVNKVHYVIFSVGDATRKRASATLPADATQTPVASAALASPEPVTVAITLPDEKAAFTVSGKVTDGENNEPLPGVNVLAKGTTTGTVTDVDGNYSVNVPDEVKSLIFSSIGYASVEVEINGRNVINVPMVTDVQSLSEVVVVGYGTQKRSDLTGAVASVSGGDLQKVAVPRIDQALQGQASGVQVTNTQNQPGGEVSIRIRGQNSISGNNNPLIVIDGILGGDLRMINPQEIQSMEVLKDASATAIYGSRGSNGVILITTKRGKTGAPRIDISSYYAMQEVRKTLPLLSAAEHRQALAEFPDQLKVQLGIADILNNVDPNVNTDWQEEVFQNAPQHEHQVSLSGGSENTQYSIMGNFFSQDGVVRNAGFTRGSLRFNLDQKIGEKFKVGLSMNLARFKRDNLSLDTEGGSQGGGVTQAALQMSPMIPVYDAQGNYSGPLNPADQLNNPMALVNERPNTTTRNYFQGGLFVDYYITSDLTFRTNLAFTNTDNLQQGYASKVLLEAAGKGFAQVEHFSTQDWLVENTLNYRKSIAEKHEVSLLGGFTAQGISTYAFGTDGLGFATEVNNFYDMSQAEVINSTSSFRDEKLASFLGRANYTFNDRYLFTVSVRADGSSKFARENKWGVFPSAAVGWRLSEEVFMKQLTAVSNLKLRGSWGLVGSQSISPYQSLASFNTIANAYSWGENVDVVGVGAGRVPNPFLRWETTEQTNVGLDLGLFEDRVSMSADVYRKITRDLLYNRQLPFYTGYSSQTDNIGSIENKGLELSLNTVNTTGEFRWTTSANFAINRNKVLDLGDDKEFFVSAIGTLGWNRQEVVVREGQPLGTFYGYVFDGIYQNAEEVASVTHPGAVPGSVRFVDITGDGVINPDDQIIIGDPNPDFIYGLTNNFSFKGFDLSILIQGVEGGDILNLTRARLETVGRYNSLRSSLNYWRGENTSNTIEAPGQFNGGMSTRFLEDGSYLRVKNIVLGYTFPAALLEKIKIRNLRIYASAVNPFTFTNYSGFDPEVNMRGNNNLLMGIDHGGFPVFKTYTMGLNIGF